MGKTYYVKATTTTGETARFDHASLPAARQEARTMRTVKTGWTRVDVCITGEGRIIAAWDRQDSSQKWTRTI